MELVEEYIESIVGVVAKQIYIMVREVRVTGDNADIDPFSSFGSILNKTEFPKENPNSQGRAFDSFREFQEELTSPPRKSSDVIREKPVIKAVLTDPQFQVLFRSLNQKRGVEQQSMPSVMGRSGQPCLSQLKEARCGVVPTLGADELTLDLAVYLPRPGQALSTKGKIKPDIKVTIWDGQTIMIETPPDKGGKAKERRFVFVTAQIMDPAGMPIHGNGLGNEAAKEKTDLTLQQQKNVKKADESALRGAQLAADGEWQASATNYQKALDLLPEHEMTGPRLKAYEEQLRRMEASIRTTHLVKHGESIYSIARRYFTSVDEMKKLNQMASDVLDVGQLILIPVNRGEPKNKVAEAVADDDLLGNALKQVIIPSIDYSDVPLQDCLGDLLMKMRKRTKGGLFPDLRTTIRFSDPEKIGNPKITLRLSNVPVTEALRYITSLAQSKFSIDGEVIVIEPLQKK